MKSNSDDSDCEDKSISNQSDDRGLEEKETYSACFSDQSYNERHGQKRSHAMMVNNVEMCTADDNSDANDSDCADDYYENFKRGEIKFRSHNYERESIDEDTQNTQNEHIEDRLSNDEADESKNVYEEVCHYNKRRKFHEEDKTDENTSHKQKSYDVKEQFIKKEHKNVPDGKDKAKRMMKMMGYQEGHGLGKHKQGRLEPVQPAKQHGRRGLGHHVPGLEASSIKWVPTEEEIKVEEDVEWIFSLDNNLPTLEDMQDWLQMGPKKLTIEDETQFCNSDIIKNIIQSKSVFDNLDSMEKRRARTRSNPYETIRGAIFLNRAAVKMANIDRACDFMFTNPNGLQSNELLYFADVCAGPGGFSEYVLWRKKWHAKGFGFTLKGENDFKLADFYAGSPETFHPYYGPKENGDVYDPSNQKSFRDLIMKHTCGKGVHFMMSDGGFSVKGQENLQEIFSKQLYLCQCLVALMIVRVKGHFVTKLFDLFTPFSVGLVYLMYRCFEEICIFKPNTSRPANSERYLICKNKRPNTDHIVQHLSHVNHLLLENDENNDVVQLVSSKELEREKQFVQYLRESNEYLGRKQILSLCKIAAFCENSNLTEPRQADVRKECLKYWQIPDEHRTIPRNMKPQDQLKTLVKSSTFLSSSPKKLTLDNIGNTILKELYDWFCMPCSSGPCNDMDRNATFYLGMGRSKVYRYVRGTWNLVDKINIELPPNTLIYAEVVTEMKKESLQQSRVLALHILDALVLGSEDISQKYIRKRHELIKKFCEALWKPDGSNYARIRVKELFPLGPNIDEKLHVKYRVLKNNRPALVYEFSETPLDCNDSDNKPYFIPNSILLLKSTAYPWNRYFSRTYTTTYVFNSKTNAKEFDLHRPAISEAGFIESFENRMIWYWPNDETLPMEKVVRLLKEKFPKYEVTLNY